jgi:hypothetical protein
MTDDHPVPAFSRREERTEPRILVVTQGLGLLNDRHEEYSRLKLFAAQDEPLKATLFWEFGRHVSKICERYEHEPFIHPEAALLASATFIELIPVFGKMREPPRKLVGFFVGYSSGEIYRLS